MAIVPQEIIDMIIGFLVKDRSTLLFAAVEVNSQRRFEGLLELSTTSRATFTESPNPFSSVRTISVLDVDEWITPEILSTLLFLPSLAQFPNIKNFRIDGLTLQGHIGTEARPMASSHSLRPGPRTNGIEMGQEFGMFRGTPSNESFAGLRDFPPRVISTPDLETLSLENCRVPSLEWFLRYISSFPNLKSLSLTNFTWQSVDDAGQCPAPQCCQSTVQPPTRLSELTLKSQYTLPIPCAPILLFEALSGSLTTLRLRHIEMFLSVDIDDGSIYLDPSYITLSPLNDLTHLTLPPIAVWLQAKQRWLPDLLSTITSTQNLKELNIHLLFSPIAIKPQLDAVMWSSIDFLLGRKIGEDAECGMKTGVRVRGNERAGGYLFSSLEVVKITSADFNWERPRLDDDVKSKIKGWLMGYMPRVYERGVLQIPSDD